MIENDSVDHTQATDVRLLDLSLLDFLRECPCHIFGYLRGLLLHHGESESENILRLIVLPYAWFDLIPDSDLPPLDFLESACYDWLLLHLFNLALQSLDVQEEICVSLASLKPSGD